jgi:F0F1-type ATP synthase assembly protein I
VTAPEPGGKKRPSSPFNHVSLGFEIAAPVVLFMGAGYLLDGWVDSQPWFLLGGALVGIAVAFYNLFRRVLPPKEGRSKR